MGRLRSRLERLEREAEGEMVFVSRRDGTVERFPQSALLEAFMANIRRLKGEDVPPAPARGGRGGVPGPGVESILLLRRVDRHRGARGRPLRVRGLKRRLKALEESARSETAGRSGDDEAHRRWMA
jgi:hypothetical protein